MSLQIVQGAKLSAIVEPMLSYIQDHWRGKLSLAKSFWLNFIGLRLALFLVQANLLQSPTKDYSSWSILLWSLIVFGHGILFVWQVVGVFRSAENHLKETGSQATVWGAQLSTAFGLFLTISYILQAWQATVPLPDEESFMVRMDREHASKYTLETSNSGETLSFEGTFELGTTRNLKALLKDAPKIQFAILNSDGGNIYEARGVAKLFREREISTHIAIQCSSACTIAFSGGKKRSMSPTAKIGFHQYRVDASYTIINANPEKEQQRDIQFFTSQGVGPAFLEKVFSRASHDMWFPAQEELLASGFIHKVE